MSTLLSIVEKLGIIVSIVLIVTSALLSQVRVQTPRWLALKKLAQAAVAGLVSGLVVAFIANLLLNFVLTYVTSHLIHDAYATCLNAIGNNICTAPFWDSASFDIYIVGALIGAGVGIARYEWRVRTTRFISSAAHAPRKS